MAGVNITGHFTATAIEVADGFRRKSGIITAARSHILLPAILER
jgi:hypothetical protein